MRNSTNVDLRFLIATNNLKHCEVAKKIGISRNSFSIWMRSEMDPVRRLRIEKAVNELLEERKSRQEELCQTSSG